MVSFIWETQNINNVKVNNTKWLDRSAMKRETRYEEGKKGNKTRK